MLTSFLNFVLPPSPKSQLHPQATHLQSFLEIPHE